jgi:hypothetical protein
MRHVQFIGIEQFALLPFSWLFKNTLSEILEYFAHASVLTKTGLNAF